ncbi:uncharacterized protein LOC125504529, partial [Dendroctonus ponderosae]|uniref:uncharacterized protein LOC125504529 n=1 Tax=Dendroctonus ponderosae TaxID=77166 RepID=UPI0020361F2E
METPIDASKAITSKKRNRSKWDNNCRISSERSSNTLCESTLSQVSQIEIGQFCPKNLFYIFIVNESDDKSASLLSNLIDINKRYEELSSITFISRDDVLDFGRTSTDCIYPNHLKPLLLSVIENTHSAPGEITINDESQILKLKLIQVMYSQYVVKVKEDDKRRSLESFLNVLTKECKKKQKKDETFSKEEDKNKYQGKDENKRKLGKSFNDGSKNEKIDYTPIPLTNDGVSYEENIFDYVWFYCFHGFYNADIIQNLLEQVGVPVSGIIKFIDQKEANDPSGVGLFWNKIEQIFFGNTTPYKYLQNTILLQFCVSEFSDSLVVLEEFVTMLRKVLNVKLTHLNYIQHLKVHKMQHSYRVIQIDCLKKYNRYLRNIPSECINPQLVLSGLLDEVGFSMESDVSEKSSLSSILFSKHLKPSKSSHCMELMRETNAMASKQKSRTQVNLMVANDDKHSFLVHDDNILVKVLKSYKYTGAKSANDTLNLMNRIPIFSGLNYLNNILDIAHKHDVNPSANQTARSDLVDNLMYVFLFSKLINNMSRSDLKSVQVPLSNLWTFDLYQYWKEVELKFHNEIEGHSDENVYDTSIVHFRWKENLSKEVLIQKVFAASDKFLYAHKQYSPESDNYLVAFSDKLDDFGINIKIVDVLVRTPVCIRDFCRYLVVDESRWLKNNRIHMNEHTFKPAFQENCPGVRKVKTQLNVFEEYFYLLDENVNEDSMNDLQTDSSPPCRPYNQKAELSFSNILSNLEKCSADMNLMEETETSYGDEDMLAYDLGSNIFKVVGKVTTFHSHDSVKVTIDNTKFLQAPDQCTFTVDSAESTLILHTSEFLLSQPFLGTIILNDNTRISFSVPEKPQIECTEGRNTLTENPVDVGDGESEIGNIVYDNDTSPVGNEAASGEQFVHYVDADFITMLLEGKPLEALSAKEETADLLESVIKATENNGVIYKVNKQSSYLKRRNANLKLPLEDALRNIVSPGAFNSRGQKAVFASPCRSNQDPNFEIKTSIDFRICLPNGLYIRPHLSVIDKKNIMIKQEYAAQKPNVLAIQQEEFRLFSNQGLVLIKKVDGTMSILKANGDMFHFEKLNGGIEEKSKVNACNCPTSADYRNKLNKMLKHDSNSPSRRK